MGKEKNFTEHYKLRNKSIKYTVQEDKGIVVAQAVFKPCTCGTFLTIGVAKVNKEAGDTFDVEKGKKLARAKAEKEAFIKHKLIAMREKKNIERILAKLENTIDKMNANIQHQNEYIKSF